MLTKFKSFRLANVEVLQYPDECVAEIIVDDGIEFTGEHAREMLKLVSNMTPPIKGVLANRKNDYSMSFEAQRLISNYRKDVKAVAILTHSKIAYIGAKFASSKFFKIGVFLDREKAVSWLLETINKPH